MDKIKFCIYLVVIAICNAVRSNPVSEMPKNYNYHYEKSGEMLKTAESNVPYANLYQIEEDTSFPEFAGSSNFGSYDGGQFIGHGFRGGLHNGNQFNSLGYNGHNGRFGFGNGFNGHSGEYTPNIGNAYINQPGFYRGNQFGGNIQRPYTHGGHVQQIGGGYVDKSQYESAKKNVGDENLEKVEAKSGATAKHGSQGFNEGSVEQSSAKGDSGYYKDEVANKNQAEDGKSYHGSSNFDKAGKKDDSQNVQKSHKKGHVTKGFKSSHRKDEEEKTETFYDEAHDEADRKNSGQNQGSFGEKSEASFKGGQEKEILDSKAQAKEGHYNSANKADDAKAKKGEFGQSEYKDNSEHLHKINGLGEQSILGQQESSGEYIKKPYGVLPINKK